MSKITKHTENVTKNQSLASEIIADQVAKQNVWKSQLQHYQQFYLQQQQQKERSEGYEKKNVFYRSDGTGWNMFHDCIITLVADKNGCT